MSHNDGQRLLSTPFNLLNSETDSLLAQLVQENDTPSTLATRSRLCNWMQSRSMYGKITFAINVFLMATERETAGIPEDTGKAIEPPHSPVQDSAPPSQVQPHSRPPLTEQLHLSILRYIQAESEDDSRVILESPQKSGGIESKTWVELDLHFVSSKPPFEIRAWSCL